MPDTNIKRAESLDDLWKVLDPQPLRTSLELQAFYRDDLNKVRGTGATKQLQLELLRRHGTTKFRCLLYGNQGCGKSTEINKILQEVEGKFRAVQVSIAQELNPSSFQVFDILLLILFRLVEEVRKLQNERFLPSLAVPESLWQDIVEYLEWASSKKESTTNGLTAKATADAFGFAKGEIQYAAGRNQEVINYRLQRLSHLADLVNTLADAANRYLADRHDQREWLIVIEDLDKQGISAASIREVLIEHSALLETLRLHLILNVPAWMVWSADSTRLPFGPNRFQMPDVPVFEAHHAPCEKGRNALREVLRARVNPDLFSDGQEDRCIVASGGNLRDLFAIVTKASTIASIHERTRIDGSDVDLAVGELRSRYETALGDNPFDKDPIPYEEKIGRLVAVYNQAGELASRHDRCLNALLKAGAVLRFNGEGRYGVHPLVVDLLHKYGTLKANNLGGSL